ncbi:hypothetical protein ACFPH6_40965 [Streptomyces xiangluensis]|uniref:Uncharacterized protein n=1 Tax=Streptomyces xiangluensis TaxID=2665720 RepID=A0ABV8Z365_9ACTN
MPKQRNSRDGDDSEQHIGGEHQADAGRRMGETQRFAQPETEHHHDPDEVTVQLDVAGAHLEDWLVQQAKGPRGGQSAQEGSDGPVFVDETGRRSRRYRRIGMAVGLTCAVYAVVIIATLLSGNSSAPWLPVPGKEDDKPASKVDSPTLPPASADPSATANPSSGLSPSTDPGRTLGPGADPSPSKSVKPTESGNPTKPEPTDPTTKPAPSDEPTGSDPTNDPTDEPTTPTQDPDPDPDPTEDPTVDPPADGDPVAAPPPAGGTTPVDPIGVIDPIGVTDPIGLIVQPAAPSSPEIVL